MNEEINKVYPCSFYLINGKSKRGPIFMTKAPVNCSKNCDSCGWNPKESARRRREGTVEKREISHDLHDDSGEVIHTVRNTCDVLVFRRQDEEAK